MITEPTAPSGLAASAATPRRLLAHAATSSACVVRLETGVKQHAAIRFYTWHGFEHVEPVRTVHRQRVLSLYGPQDVHLSPSSGRARPAGRSLHGGNRGSGMDCGAGGVHTAVADTNDWNDKVIAEFRANDGQVGGNFAGAPLLLLHTTGATSGAERVSPMMYQQVDDGWAVFASYAGKDINPAWYHNLKANPAAAIEVGTETVDVTARDLPADEREPVWDEQKRRYPGFAEYEANTTRTIPVVLLTRR